MGSRDTGTGAVLEEMVLPALRRGGYQCQRRVRIGERFGGGRHIVDIVARDPEGRVFLISLKWQQGSGTAEQKVPFEAMCLAEAILSGSGEYQKAYLVLGGIGWRLKDFYVGGGLNRHMLHSDLVNILPLEHFIAKANRGQL